MMNALDDKSNSTTNNNIRLRPPIMPPPTMDEDAKLKLQRLHELSTSFRDILAEVSATDDDENNYVPKKSRRQRVAQQLGSRVKLSNFRFTSNAGNSLAAPAEGPKTWASGQLAGISDKVKGISTTSVASSAKRKTKGISNWLSGNTVSAKVRSLSVDIASDDDDDTNIFEEEEACDSFNNESLLMAMHDKEDIGRSTKRANFARRRSQSLAAAVSDAVSDVAAASSSSSLIKSMKSYANDVPEKITKSVTKTVNNSESRSRKFLSRSLSTGVPAAGSSTAAVGAAADPWLSRIKTATKDLTARTTMAMTSSSSATTTTSSKTSEDNAYDGLTLTDFLASPALTRSFLDHLKIKDSFKLMFICSVDEFKTLEESNENLYQVQVLYARNIVTKFMTEGSCFDIIGTIDRDAGARILEKMNNSTVLSQDLFDGPYNDIMDDLDRAFKKFRQTDAYERISQEFDTKSKNLQLKNDVVDNAYKCLVFWAYLKGRYEVQHRGLGFYMEHKQCKTKSQLVQLSQKYLEEDSPLKWYKDQDLKSEIRSALSDDDDKMNIACEKLQVLAQRVVDSCECYYPEFLKSDIYEKYGNNEDKEFLQEQLFTECNIDFIRASRGKAQSAAAPPVDDAAVATSPLNSDSHGICNVFSFALEDKLSLVHHLYDDGGALPESLSPAFIQPYLYPEGEGQAETKVFNIILEINSCLFYGAVYRGNSDGFCLLSRYAILESLRSAAVALAPPPTTKEQSLASKKLQYTDLLTDVLNDVTTRRKTLESSYRLDDLFEALSLSNIFIILAAVMAGKSVTLVSDSISHLCAVSLALRDLTAPFSQEHLFYPIMPEVQEVLGAPYIAGVHSSSTKALKDTLVVYLDQDRITEPTTTTTTDVLELPVRLPERVTDRLRSELRPLLAPRLYSRDDLVTLEKAAIFPTASVLRVFKETFSTLLIKPLVLNSHLVKDVNDQSSWILFDKSNNSFNAALKFFSNSKNVLSII